MACAMFARILVVLVCFIGAVLRPGLAEPVDPPHRKLVVYLKTPSGQPQPPVEEMKREVNALMDDAGYLVSWRSPGDYGRDEGDAAVIVSELQGVCEAPRPGTSLEPPATGATLASTAVSDGKVLPFIVVDCSTVTRLLASALPNEAAARREFLYGRALGRVVAHELFHALTGTREHDDGGIAKHSFRASDVLAEHFEFEVATLKRFRESAP
ncbi:MAG TPA: hypothetical protein VGL82_03685, partial [Bryobacteraceae bacterium]